MNALNGFEGRPAAILEILRSAEGLMPISAIHDRLPQDLRASAQLTFQECQRLAKEGAVEMEDLPGAGGRKACRFIKNTAAPSAPEPAPPYSLPAALLFRRRNTADQRALSKRADRRSACKYSGCCASLPGKRLSLPRPAA